MGYRWNGMELILILAAVLACLVAGVAVAAMSARGRRPPLRLDNDLDERDEDFLLTEVGPTRSPIDRSADVLEAEDVPQPRLVQRPAREH